MNSNKTMQLAGSTTAKLEVEVGFESLRKEAELGSREGFERDLAAVPDVPPQENDRLED